MIKKLALILLFTTLLSCDYFSPQKEVSGVVVLNNHALSKEAIDDILPKNVTPTDSIKIVNVYIKSWATSKLLYDKAVDNLDDDKQRAMDKLVDGYRTDLYAQAYLQELTKQNLDTIISAEKIAAYYELNRGNFKLNEDLAQFKYILLSSDYKDRRAVEKLLKSTDLVSRAQLDSLSIGFKNYFLNDSLWVSKKTVLERITAITPATEKYYLKDRSYWRLEDSLGVYLVRFENVLRRGEQAPLPYVKPTIKQVLLNKEKLAYIKKLEKDLLNDAIERDKLKINE